MTSRDFAYWLQGYFELSTEEDGKEFEGNIPQEIARKIQRHLAMVFIHEIDPSHGPKAHQEALTAAHQGGGSTPKPLVETMTSGIGVSALMNC